MPSPDADPNPATGPVADGERRAGLSLLRHVAMEVTVEIGRTLMTVQELLSLHPGDVVGLDRAADAPADLRVNGTLMARGEVVVVGDDFGLRISEMAARTGPLGADPVGADPLSTVPLGADSPGSSTPDTHSPDTGPPGRP